MREINHIEKVQSQIKKVLDKTKAIHLYLFNAIELFEADLNNLF